MSVDYLIAERHSASSPLMGGGAFYELGGYSNGDYANLFFYSAIFPDAPEPDLQRFQNQYATAFDPDHKHPGQYGWSRVTPNGASSYDAVKAYLQAIADVGGTSIPTTEQVRTALQTVGFPGAAGYVKFSPNTSNPDDKPSYIVCVSHEGTTHELIKYTPQGNTQVADNLSVCL